ncbi:MAG TPA: photosynthetic reaction center cytochrome c subunit family protein, partial [Vicinamibacterales bacterium]|nr:photosynthetic reaction center cytochrome c subunit family protein [Vicinamibacterales bacterium]
MSRGRAGVAVVGMAAIWMSGLTLVARDQASPARQTVAPAPGKKAGEAFKNVTTSALKELSVDDFIASMGLISANLGLDCADCHPNAGTDKADFVIDTPRKVTARRMVDMVSTLNRTNFAGVQRVTCWTCH